MTRTSVPAKLIDTSLVHKVLPPRRAPAGGRSPALVLLHGRGANEDDLLGLQEFLDERLFIIAARAPFPFAYGGGFTWFDILEIGRPEPAMFAESYRKLVRFLEDIRTGYPVLPERIILFGFSMGTMMAYSIALTEPESVCAVAANSGVIPEETDLTFLWEALRGKPFFVSHGVYDPVIPVAFGKRAGDLLRRAHADVTYREYDMGHEIGEESLRDVLEWMAKHL